MVYILLEKKICVILNKNFCFYPVLPDEYWIMPLNFQFLIFKEKKPLTAHLDVTRSVRESAPRILLQVTAVHPTQFPTFTKHTLGASWEVLELLFLPNFKFIHNAHIQIQLFISLSKIQNIIHTHFRLLFFLT